jgi:hypothetical protein
MYRRTTINGDIHTLHPAGKERKTGKRGRGAGDK